jgi:hypothetical protein
VQYMVSICYKGLHHNIPNDISRDFQLSSKTENAPVKPSLVSSQFKILPYW